MRQNKDGFVRTIIAVYVAAFWCIQKVKKYVTQFMYIKKFFFNIWECQTQSQRQTKIMKETNIIKELSNDLNIELLRECRKSFLILLYL